MLNEYENEGVRKGYPRSFYYQSILQIDLFKTSLLYILFGQRILSNENTSYI